MNHVPQIDQIGAADAHDRQTADPATVLLDVRTVEEFEAGHPAGAINVPVVVPGPMGMQPNPEFLTIVAAVVPKDVPVIATCRSGQRSMLAAQLMAGAGWQNLTNLRPGFSGQMMEPGWAALSLPVEDGSPDGRGLSDLRQRAGLS